MFDDLFCATALTAVGAVLAAGVYSGASELSAPARAVAAIAAPASVVSNAAPKAAMPVYVLPRVVVTGNRSRDGDLVAGDLPTRDGRAGER